MQQATPFSLKTLWRQIRGYVLAVIVALLITTFGVTTVAVSGRSMEPTLDGGTGQWLESLYRNDRLLIPKYDVWLRRARLLPGYQRGEIVVFREPESSPYATVRQVFLVKRIIGLPGDTVSIMRGRVFINGTELDQSFITGTGGDIGLSNLAPLPIPEGHYFVLGDNRRNSVDSRVFGAIPFWSVTGRASAVIWPPARSGERNWRTLRIPAAFQAIPEP